MTDPAQLGEQLLARWPAARPFVWVGSTLIVSGGLVAAVTRPTDFELGPWLAAFLVLVGGVAQIALGAGQAWISRTTPSPGLVRSELATWNLAVLLTVIGSCVPLPISTLVGGVVMLAALGAFLAGVRSTAASVRARVVVLYRAVVVVVLVSTPIGLVLSFARHG